MHASHGYSTATVTGCPQAPNPALSACRYLRSLKRLFTRMLCVRSAIVCVWMRHSAIRAMQLPRSCHAGTDRAAERRSRGARVPHRAQTPRLLAQRATMLTSVCGPQELVIRVVGPVDHADHQVAVVLHRNLYRLTVAISLFCIPNGRFHGVPFPFALVNPHEAICTRK